MARRKKTQPFFHFDENGTLTSGVGSEVGLAFVETYFPKAFQTVRIASGYFELSGYDLARDKFNSSVQLRILVRIQGGQGKTSNWRRLRLSKNLSPTLASATNL